MTLVSPRVETPLITFLLLALGQSPAIGATFDVPAGDVGALVAAIDAANDEGVNPGADTLVLENGTYTLTDASTGGGFVADGINGLPSISSEITIEGNGSQIVRDAAAANFRILHVAPTGVLTLDDAAIRNGVTSGTSGLAGSGGGLFSRGAVTLNRVTIADNASLGFDEGGGGLYVTGAGSSMALNRSTVSGNVANRFGAGIFCESSGGAETVSLNHSTVSGNTSADSGGGISSIFCGLTLSHGSVVNNQAFQFGAGVSNLGGEMSLRNTLIAGNRDDEQLSPNCANGFGGTITLEGVSLTDDDRSKFDGTSCGLTEMPDLVLNSIDPAGTLADLADNGGLTQTHALLDGSSAIDAAVDVPGQDACGVGDNASDQRGVPRPLGAACEVGSFEYGSQPPVFIASTPPDGTLFPGMVGEMLSVALAAEDPDASDTVQIGHLGLPAGATLSAEDGNPATATLDFVPQAAGSYGITFTAIDDRGEAADPTGISVDVACRPVTIDAKEIVLHLDAGTTYVSTTPVAFVYDGLTDAPLAGKTVSFHDENGASVCEARTDPSGRASCELVEVIPPLLQALSLSYSARTADDGQHCAGQDEGDLFLVLGVRSPRI